jgi:uncharacterized protein with HEPN domain
LPSDKPVRRLEDIVENAQAIQRCVAGFDLARSQEDRRTYDAVERCLGGQPWEEIGALGNRLRHEYDSIRADRLWDTVQIDLPSLCEAYEAALQSYFKEPEGL